MDQTAESGISFPDRALPVLDSNALVGNSFTGHYVDECIDASRGP